MRICYLAPAGSSHMSKWSHYMSLLGHDVHVISLTPGALDDAEVHQLKVSASPKAGDAKKLLYLTKASETRHLIKTINPDVLHAHYATSYGLLASLAADRPYFLSVWGSDVYDFPRRSPIHRLALKHSLKHATWLMSTSRAMASEASQYTDKCFAITPFGVDMELFSPDKRTRREQDGRFVVGTVKALEKEYGIDTLLRGVSEATRLRPDIPIEVRIAGKGSMEDELQSLASELGLGRMVSWLGYISQENAALEWANMDVALVTSESESFGVSVVEAQASGVPVIYTDIPGLSEACGDGTVGLCVRRNDFDEIARRLIWLYDNPKERKRMGDDGRRHAQGVYEVNSCFDVVESLYQRALSESSRSLKR